MNQWKIERIATLSDRTLEAKLNEIENNPQYEIKEIVYMGDNSGGERIYQIIYVEEK